MGVTLSIVDDVASHFCARDWFDLPDERNVTATVHNGWWKIDCSTWDLNFGMDTTQSQAACTEARSVSSGASEEGSVRAIRGTRTDGNFGG